MSNPKVNITIWPDRRKHIISPMLHGQNIENLGQIIYDGIWIEEDSGYSKYSGIRTELVDSVREIRAGVIKWPGGPSCETYHWEDGIGERKSRPTRRNIYWGGSDPNSFGTVEFIDLCRKVNAQPVICLNAGTGSIKEAAEWLEYCNFRGNSKLSSMRKENGHDQPFNVTYWSFGYQPWDYLSPSQYCMEFQRCSSLLKESDPSIQLIACGKDEKWNLSFFQNLENNLNLIDLFSIKSTFSSRQAGGGSHPETEQEYYAIFGYVPMLHSHLVGALNLLNKVEREGKRIGLVLDQWGIHHPGAVIETGMHQPTTLRDALVTGYLLHLFYHLSDYLTMANLSYMVNGLHTLMVTRKELIVKTPVYYIFELLANHTANTMIKTRVDSPLIKIKTQSGNRKIPVVDVFASINSSYNQITITLINIHIEKQAKVKINIKGTDSVKKGFITSLTADSPNDENSFISPHLVKPQNNILNETKNPLEHTLPPHSAVKINIRLT